MTEPTAKTASRPISPHLQVYKPQITSVLSILHRITGVLLSVFAVGWLVWLICLNRGQHQLQAFIELVSSTPGKLVVLLACWALFYHLLNGIRHLIWDAGYGLEMDTARRSGWIVVILSLILTTVAGGYWL